ncbi:MAG: ATP-grasp domain-containing protein [Lachnospiraceae bacterium]|nr:ATP-grasp domain-containing protein [Lachnospiraceae bacterium]
MLYWIGPRDSDVSYTSDMFDGMITLFGDEKHGNSSAFCKNYHSRVNHNIIDEDQDNFTITEVMNRLSEDADAEFMFYNPNIVYKIKKLMDIRKHILCLNEAGLMELINNKISFRKIFKNLVDMLDCKIILSGECQYENLKKIFGITSENTKFIVQAPVASGGYGTFLLGPDNEHAIQGEIIQGSEYLVSVYLQKSVSVNGHMIIFDNHILLTPCSVQIMKESDNRLFYRGADFITYKKISEQDRKEFESKMYIVGQKLQQMGYRGICGVDGMITEDKVYVLEVNNRFQASTPLINLKLSKIGQPSLHEINRWAFEGKDIPEYLLDTIPNMDIPYSNYIYTSGDVNFHLSYFYNLVLKDKNRIYVEDIVRDGYNPLQPSENAAYQYKVIFNTNISGINGNGEVTIYSNIEEPSRKFYREVEKKNLLYLKVALLNQGIWFSSNALKKLERQGGIRPGTNCSVDILMGDIVINCPVNTKFSEFSPFSVDVDYDKIKLYYYNSFLKEIHINPVDIYSMKKTKNGIPFNAIANLSSDRLRIHHTTTCIFKSRGKGCAFCDIEMGNENIAMEDIYEVIDFYLENTNFKHFLIGGQSEKSLKEYPYIIETIKYIRIKSNKNIYVMCLPPKEKDIVRNMCEAGATEIGFNIEVFERSYAMELMPGKGNIPLKQYMDALKQGVSLLGESGNVRSIILVGLENDETFFRGIEELAKNHIQPILSIFRPLPKTKMFHETPPSNEYLIQVYNKASKLCEKYGMRLGPSCVQCQNNTLSLPESYR